MAISLIGLLRSPKAARLGQSGVASRPGLEATQARLAQEVQLAAPQGTRGQPLSDARSLEALRARYECTVHRL